jgi:hypothetical protein
MNTNIKNETALNRFANTCVFSCQKLVAQIKRTKDNLQAEYRETIKAHEQLLHLALNEAEALAWETPYPHLVFPTLAMEKAQAVANWDAHQRSIRRTGSSLRLAA